jgi:hypothetical protein
MTYFYAQLFAMDTEIRAHDHDIMHGTIPRTGRQAHPADQDVYISGPIT